MTKQLSDSEIIKKQERLYELERDCSTGPPMTEEEIQDKIREFLADDYSEKLRAQVEARKRELVQEIAVTSDPRRKERLQRNLELLSGC